MDDAFAKEVERLTEDFAERIAGVAANEREYVSGMQYALEILTEQLSFPLTMR